MNRKTSHLTNSGFGELNRIWDGHIHLFPPKLFQAIYRVFTETYGWNLAFKDYHPQLLKYLRNSGIDQASVLVYAHKPNISLEINRWLAQLVKEYPWLVPYGCIHPHDMNMDEVLYEALEKYDFAGLKIHSLVKRIPPDTEKLFPVYEKLVQKNKGVIIHGSTFPLDIPECLGLHRIFRILEKFPNLSVLIPHMGLDELSSVGELLEKYPQAYVDTAFVFNNHNIFSLPFNHIKELIKQFPRQVIYGSDFPFVINEPTTDIQNILNLQLPREIYSQLFYTNARDFAAAKQYK